MSIILKLESKSEFLDGSASIQTYSTSSLAELMLLGISSLADLMAPYSLVLL